MSKMSQSCSFSLALLFLFLFIHSSYSKCPKSFQCGPLGTLTYPFSSHPNCALVFINCTIDPPRLQFQDSRLYEVVKIISKNTFILRDIINYVFLSEKDCIALKPLSLLESTPSISFTINYPKNTTILACIKDLQLSDLSLIRTYFRDEFEIYRDCIAFDFYYSIIPLAFPNSTIPGNCTKILKPIKSNQTSNNLFGLLSAEFEIEFNVSATQGHKKPISSSAIGAICVGAAFIVVVILFVLHRLRMMFATPTPTSARAPTIQLVRMGSTGAGSLRRNMDAPLFTYDELEEATEHFNPSRLLGEGSYGEVFYGRLNDGREVAVKRMYNRGASVVESFHTEVRTLSRLRHPNLVTLYGHASNERHELFLVYDYVSNGSVEERLQGTRAGASHLTWVLRMRIAMETASALHYLHQSDVIHRDIKTANILLDQDQHVKVCDFGVARGIPNNATHVTTLPHGTMGYIDPVYFQRFHLTTKSDVYSFGVVLVELISSKLPFDHTRQSDELKLGDYALARIQNQEYDALFDQTLGYTTDVKVARMLRSVAELAFRCLQPHPDLRPSMNEVVDVLNDIQARGGA